MKFAETEREKARSRHNRTMSLSQILSLFQEHVSVGLKEIAMEQVRQFLYAGTAMAL